MLNYFLGDPKIAKRLEIIIDTRVLHARLLRKASTVHPRFLDLAESQLELGFDEVKELRSNPNNDSENIANIGAYPSSEIEKGLELQRLLNNARRCKPYQNKSKQQEMAKVNELRKKFLESQKKESMPIKMFSNIHIWWTYQIEFRFACKSFNYTLYLEKKKQMEKYLEHMKSENYENEYLREIMDKTSPSAMVGYARSKDRRKTKSLFELQLAEIYHEKLRDCIDGEIKSKVKRNDQTNSHLLESIFSGIELKDTGIYNRVKLEKNINNYHPVVLTTDCQKEVMFGTSLVEDCRHSIRNSLLILDHIIRKNRHTSSVEIVLASIDLLLRIRRYLSIPALRKKYPTRQGRTIKEYIKNNHGNIAIEIRDGVTFFLSNVIKFINEKDELEELCSLFKDWKKYLEEDLEQSNLNRNALGTLCGKCGILIGCPLVIDYDPHYAISANDKEKLPQIILEKDYSNFIKDWLNDEFLKDSLLLFSPAKFDTEKNQQIERRTILDEKLKTVKGDIKKEQTVKKEVEELDKILRIKSSIFFTTNPAEIKYNSVFPYLSPAGETTIQESND